MRERKEIFVSFQYFEISETNMRGGSRGAAGKEVVRYEIGVHNFMANTGFTFSRAELSAAAVTNAG